MNAVPLAVLGVAISALAGVAGCRTHAEAAPPPLRAAVALADVRASTGAPLVLRGSVAVRARLPLGFRGPGVVKDVRVRAGDHVVKGQLLATLDAADAEARVRAASVAFGKAQREAKQAETLVRSGSVASTAHEDARSALESARADLDFARETARATRLAAPVSGTILSRVAEPGESIAASSPVLVLDDTTTLVVKLGATVEQLDHVRASNAVTLLGPSGRELGAAMVSALPTTGDARTGIFDVELRPDGATSSSLRAGDLVSAKFVGVTAQL